MTFEELGSVLRAEREKRGLSLDNVAEHLKISARILRALEEGDESSLPHTVYVRGFVRSYGNYLGLDSEELQEGMMTLTDEEQDVQPTSVYVAPETETGRSGGKIFLIIFVLLCAAGAAFFWFYRDADLFSELQQARLSTAQPAPPLNSRVEKEEAPAPRAAKPATKPAQQGSTADPAGSAQKSAAAGQKAQEGQAGQNPPPATAPASAGVGQAAAPAATQQSATQQNAAQQNAAQQAAAQQAVTQQSSAAQQQGAPQASAPAVRDAAPVSGHNKIIITALAECWIHSNADGTDTRQFSLRKGDTFALTFADKLVLKLGNAGGVRIRYNGEDLPAQGKDGQVRTLTFPLSAQ